MFNANEVPKGTHTVEVREESYGFTLAHRCDKRVLYLATYQNSHDAMRQARKITEQERADSHEVIVVSDPGLA